MKLTKKQLKRIVNLFNEGLSEEVCIAALLELIPPNTTSLEQGQIIHEFYKQIYSIQTAQPTPRQMEVK